MAGINSLIDAEGNHFIRRCIAFAIDVIFAASVAMLIPSAVAEESGGRYRLTAGPGFHFTYCYPFSEHSKSTAAIIDQVVRSAPSYVGQPKVENCITVLNLLARSSFVQIGFARPDQPFGWRLVRVPTDFSGEPVRINPLDHYVPLLVAVFLSVFLASAWLGSPGMRLTGIRIRSSSGESAGNAAFIIRYGVLAIAFAPLLLPFGDISTRLFMVVVANAVLVLPWYKGRSQKRRGLHDVLAGTAVVRFA